MNTLVVNWYNADGDKCKARFYNEPSWIADVVEPFERDLHSRNIDTWRSYENTYA